MKYNKEKEAARIALDEYLEYLDNWNLEPNKNANVEEIIFFAFKWLFRHSNYEISNKSTISKRISVLESKVQDIDSIVSKFIFEDHTYENRE